MKTIGHHFQDADYRTFVAGKWQLYGARHYSKQFRAKGTLPSQAGFDECCLWQVDELGGRYWKPLLYINGKNKQFGGDAYGPKIVTDAIVTCVNASVTQK